MATTCWIYISVVFILFWCYGKDARQQVRNPKCADLFLEHIFLVLYCPPPCHSHAHFQIHILLHYKHIRMVLRGLSIRTHKNHHYNENEVKFIRVNFIRCLWSDEVVVLLYYCYCGTLLLNHIIVNMCNYMKNLLLKLKKRRGIYILRPID